MLQAGLRPPWVIPLLSLHAISLRPEAVFKLLEHHAFFLEAIMFLKKLSGQVALVIRAPTVSYEFLPLAANPINANFGVFIDAPEHYITSISQCVSENTEWRRLCLRLRGQVLEKVCH
jgi:hypothetical protein